MEKKEKSNVIIKNYEDFNTLIFELNIEEEDYEKLLSIDLEKHDLLVCFLGEKTTSGNDNDVENVEVILKEMVPEKNAMVTMSFTSPYMFVTLPKNKAIVVK